MADEKSRWMKDDSVAFSKFVRERQSFNTERTAAIIFPADPTLCRNFTAYAQAIVDNLERRSGNDVNALLMLSAYQHDEALNGSLHSLECEVILGAAGPPVKS